MLSDLKYLTNAVARKDFVEELCHFHIHNGIGWAYDGMVSMATYVDIDMTVRPHASSFIRAIAACDDETRVAMHMTEAGRLGIRSGKFRAFVKCLDPYAESLPIPKPEGDLMVVSDELLDSMIELAPFMAIDASRPWAMGLRIAGNSTYATNNVILLQRWHGSNFPHEVIIPADFVKAMIKIDEKPILAQVTDTSLTFHFQSERWIRTQLVIGEWPPNLDSRFKESPVAQLIPEGFFQALDQLKPFIDDRGRVFVFRDRLATSDVEGEGASVDIETPFDGALFHLEHLRLLQSVVKTIDLSAYPAPCPWFGKKIRGLIVGQRM